MEGDAPIALFSKKRKKSKRRPNAAGAAAATVNGPADDHDTLAAGLGLDAPLPERATGQASTSAPDGGGDRPPQLTEAEDFKSLGVSDWLSGVCRSLGITRPTQVQAGCIPAILAGRDVVGAAQTGSGKTAAFALPILQTLSKDPYGVYALVLTPTRELAVQLAEQFRAFGAGMSLKDAVIIGGMDMHQQARELARRPHVVVATPGRLADHLDSDAGLAAGFERTRFLVLDEADRLLDPTFEAPLRSVLAALPPADGEGGSGGGGGRAPARRARQTLLFSATMTKALGRLQGAMLSNAFVFQAYEGLRTADELTEQYVFIPAKVREVYLAHLLASLEEQGVRSAIVFCSTCRGCRLLELMLQELGLPCTALHSGKPQKQRLAALSQFRSEVVPLLLATDVASRGLDIPTVDLVVNFDLPVQVRDYVHRVGRTARAGRGGRAVSFVTQHDIELVHAIEALIGHQLEALEMPEGEVLKGITRVYAARRAALLTLADEERAEGGASKRRRRQAAA